MKSFLQGKKALIVPPLRPVAGPAPASVTHKAAPPAPHTHAPKAGGGAPNVEVVKEGDKIVRLVVVCSCGERIEIECLYPSG